MRPWGPSSTDARPCVAPALRLSFFLTIPIRIQGMPLTNEDVQVQLTRRRPGQSALTTPRNESDSVSLQSGIESGVTIGTPIGLLVKNKDQRPHDYSETDWYPRPSHADWTYLLKYDIKASSGGGRSSARETIGRVAAGAIAEKYLKLAYGVEIVAFVSSVGKIHMPTSSNEDETLDDEYIQLLKTVTRDDVDKNLIRCPHAKTATLMEEVRIPRTFILRMAADTLVHRLSESFSPGTTTIRLEEPSPA